MKLCIPSTGKDINAQIDMRLGRTLYFLIIDTDTMNLEIVENDRRTYGEGVGISAVNSISGKNVEGVLVGSIGSNASKALRASGIKIFDGASSTETIKEAVIKFKNNEYSEAIVTPVNLRRGEGRGWGMGRGMGQNG